MSLEDAIKQVYSVLVQQVATIRVQIDNGPGHLQIYQIIQFSF